MDNNQQTYLEIINHIINKDPSLIQPIKHLVESKISEFENQILSEAQRFSLIYKNGLWGKSSIPNNRFFSGSSSHEINITTNYITAVSKFLKGFAQPPSVLDLGCGDFNVGSKLRVLCNSYIAADIVPELIEFNCVKYSNLNIDFQVIDLVDDILPHSDVIFVRQVLQHLSNSQILKFIAKLYNGYKWLILTEHIPSNLDFKHNIDHPSGQNIRLGQNSGVVLTSPPFNLKIIDSQILTQTEEGIGIIQTIAYQLST